MSNLLGNSQGYNVTKENLRVKTNFNSNKIRSLSDSLRKSIYMLKLKIVGIHTIPNKVSKDMVD